MTTIGNLTLEELRHIIDERIEEQLPHWLGSFEMDDDLADDGDDHRTLAEVFESIERNRWTPPPGSPSPSEMLREDRDER